MSKDMVKMSKAREYITEKVIRDIFLGKKAKNNRNELRSALLFRIGKNHYHDREAREAIGKFIKAIGYNCFNGKAYIYICLSLLPINLIKKIINLRRSGNV
jgi:hypothetical protein